MKGLTPKKMAAACGGQYYGPKEIADTEVTAVTTDSRKVTKGCLFVPLKGTRSDGHDYIPQVMRPRLYSAGYEGWRARHTD